MLGMLLRIHQACRVLSTACLPACLPALLGSPSLNARRAMRATCRSWARAAALSTRTRSAAWAWQTCSTPRSCWATPTWKPNSRSALSSGDRESESACGHASLDTASAAQWPSGGSAWLRALPSKVALHRSIVVYRDVKCFVAQADVASKCAASSGFNRRLGDVARTLRELGVRHNLQARPAAALHPARPAGCIRRHQCTPAYAGDVALGCLPPSPACDRHPRPSLVISLCACGSHVQVAVEGGLVSVDVALPDYRIAFFLEPDPATPHAADLDPAVLRGWAGGSARPAAARAQRVRIRSWMNRSPFFLLPAAGTWLPTRPGRGRPRSGCWSGWGGVCCRCAGLTGAWQSLLASPFGAPPWPLESHPCLASERV
jgi:hypothetical protein